VVAKTGKDEQINKLTENVEKNENLSLPEEKFMI
jgi:hypothetical protein